MDIFPFVVVKVQLLRFKCVFVGLAKGPRILQLSSQSPVLTILPDGVVSSLSTSPFSLLSFNTLRDLYNSSCDMKAKFNNNVLLFI